MSNRDVKSDGKLRAEPLAATLPDEKPPRTPARSGSARCGVRLDGTTPAPVPTKATEVSDA
jgi:hypothetical protein